MTDREYLEQTNIVRLQAAARMAGLRWKNGEPGTDKAGIIQRLSGHPSIMRATISALERLARGEDAPRRKTLAEELAEEQNEQPTTVVPQETPAPTPISEALLHAYVTRDEHGQTRDKLSQRIETVHEMAQGNIAKLSDRIDALQERRPIEFHFPDRAPITIEPGQHHESFPKLIKYLQLNRRVILVGSAGTGKSLAVKNAAEFLGVPFHLQPPVTMSHELIGHRDAMGVFHSTPLVDAYINGGLILMDEADACLPDALLCANPIFDGNGFATLGDGKLHEQHKDFYAVFNMNTDGFGATMQYAGRNRLDGATVARFGVRISWAIDSRIESTYMASGQAEWHKAIVAVRDFMVSRDIVDVNATPRHLKTGALLLNGGCPRREILEDCLKNGALESVWSDVCRLPAVASFLRG